MRVTFETFWTEMSVCSIFMTFVTKSEPAHRLCVADLNLLMSNNFGHIPSSSIRSYHRWAMQI